MAGNTPLLCVDWELLQSFRLLNHGLFPHHYDDTVFRDVIALPIGLQIVADFSALGDGNVTVDNGVASARVASDIYMVEQDGVFHIAITIDAHIVTNHRTFYAAAGND